MPGSKLSQSNYFNNLNSYLLKSGKLLISNSLIFAWLLLISHNSYAQKGTWIEVNDGFAKCAGMNQTGGYATWDQDDFEIEDIIDRQGDVYAEITYNGEGTNTTPCGSGFFRFSDITNSWTKVANPPPGRITVTNHLDIFSLGGGDVWQYTDDKNLYPTGWKMISQSELKGDMVFSNSSCSPFNIWEGFHFKYEESAAAIGKNIYVLMLAEKTCANENKVGIFDIEKGTWTLHDIGPLPHQGLGSDVSSQHFDFRITEKIAGYFQYFISYNWWGKDKWIPNYVWVFDPRNSQWRNISEGIEFHNITGTSNPEQKINPNKPANGWGPCGGITVSWDQRDIYAKSEKGIWRWAGDKWYWIADYRTNTRLTITSNGIYAQGRGFLDKLEAATYAPVGQPEFFDCAKQINLRHLTTPDDGKTLFIRKKGPTVAGDCDSEGAELGIYRLIYDPDQPDRVRNLHVETATYLGGPDDNTPVNTGVGKNHQVFVAGNFSSIQAPNTFTTTSINGASSASRGRIIKMNTFGDTIRHVLNLGNEVYDYEMQNFGNYQMVVSGDFGVCLINADGTDKLWTIPAASIPGNGSIAVDIDDTGHVVVMRDKKFTVYNAAGNPMAAAKDVPGNYVNDITIKNDTIYVVGFNNGSLNGTGCGETGGLPVQSAFVKSYTLKAGAFSEDVDRRTFGFPGNQLGLDQADTRGYKINVGKDGKIYFLGEAAGGNSVFRWNGKNTIALNGCSNPPSRLVQYDQYNSPYNTASAHIAYFCTIDPLTGEVERGQYIIPRLTSGKSNTYRIKDGYIHADQKGYVYIGATSAYAIAGRQIQHLNGELVDDYAGGDMVVLMVDPNYRVRTFWGVFSREAGKGSIRGFGIRDNIISAIGKTEEGKMIPTSNAIQQLPFNGSNKDLNDAYLAMWYQDVWNHAPLDTLEERTKESEEVIPEDQYYNKAAFEVDKTSTCVGVPVTFTDKSIGAKKWIWDFGLNSSLSAGTQNRGPHVVSYSQPGLKTVKLTAILQDNSTSEEEKFQYINVMETGLQLGEIEGPVLVCAGSPAIYKVEPVLGVDEYQWTLPTGAYISKGAGENEIEVIFAGSSGQVKVKPKYACGTGPESVLDVNVFAPAENNVILVVGQGPLSDADAGLKTKLEENYSVTVVEDTEADPTHAGCASLIVISNSVSATEVNFKFRNATIPVITLKADLFDNMGLTNGSYAIDYGQSLGTIINVIDNTSELAGTITTGNKTVYNLATNVNWGKPNGNALVVAEASTGKAAIFGYEKDAAMFGLNAPERRVGLFITDNGTGNANLTADAIYLLERALCWVMYTCPNDVNITTGAINISTACPGGAIEVPFTATGSIAAGNVYSAQLSNANGEFVSPLVIGTLVSSALNGTIQATIPPEVQTGTGYRVRVVGSNPSSIGSDNGTDLNIGGSPLQPGPILGNALACRGETVQTYRVDPMPGISEYVWEIPLGTHFVDNPNQVTWVTDNEVTIDFGTGTSNEIKVYAKNSCGVSEEASRLQVSMTDQPPVITGGISGREAVCLAFTAETYAITPPAGATEYTWTLPPGATGSSTENFIVVDFSAASSGPMTVQATGACGDSEVVILDITLEDPCTVEIAKFTADKEEACAGEAIQFIDESIGAVTYFWEFGPDATPQTSTEANPVVTYSQGGSKNVILTINKDTPDETSEIRLGFVTVNGIPAEPTINGNTTVCQGAPAETYSVMPSVYADTYHWTLPDGTLISNDQYSISIDFSSQTSGDVKVYLEGQCGQSSEAVLPVVVDPGCTSLADFEASETTICAGTPVSFRDKSSGATSWYWIFGEGASPATYEGEKPPSVTYASGGLKEVTLIINRGEFLEATETKTDYITVGDPPAQPGVITGPANACPNQQQTFEITAVPGALSYQWEIMDGDAQIIAGAEQTQVTVDLGEQPVNISVAANFDCGASQPSEKSIEVTPLNIGLLDGPDETCQGSTETFTLPVAAGASSYTWTMSSGASGNSNTNTIDVQFNSSGEQMVTVVANYDGCGSSLPSEWPVMVDPCIFEADFSSATTTICAGVPVTLTDNSEGAETWYWDLGEGASPRYSNEPNPVVIYNSKGWKDVLLVINQGLINKEDSMLKTNIYIVDSIPESITAIEGPAEVCIGTSHSYRALPKLDAVDYQWVLPAGTTGSSTVDTIALSFEAFLGGEMSVSATNQCGASEPAILSILPKGVLLPSGELFGPEEICRFDTAYYDMPAIDGATAYEWSIPEAAFTEENMDSNTLEVIFRDNVSEGDSIALSVYSECGLAFLSVVQLKAGLACEEEDIFIPNLITPGSFDGNATWQIKGLQLFPQAEVTIFNRWGSQVYHTTGLPDQWDGRVNGSPLPDGTYYYVIDLKDNSEPRTGSLTILTK